MTWQAVQPEERIVAGVIVRAEKVERRVEQTRLLQAEIDGVGAVVGAEAARAESLVGRAGVFLAVGQADFETALAAALEDAQDIAGLRNLPARERVEEGEPALCELLVRVSAAGT